MLREDRDFAAAAARISALAKDITEYVGGIELQPAQQQSDIVIAYHSACSLQHGQKIAQAPKELLSKNGFVVKDVPESHLCCGSAGTYNILQPDIANKLRDRKVANIAMVKPDMIAAGNIGCMVQIASGTSVPVMHTIELLDWATGGPQPGSSGSDGLERNENRSAFETLPALCGIAHSPVFADRIEWTGCVRSDRSGSPLARASSFPGFRGISRETHPGSD